jgi:hypothetical protein
MMRIANALLCCCLGTVLFNGCAPTRTWVSSPKFQSADNATFAARFTPLRSSGEFINGFLLEVKNKTRQPLDIDWNSSRYLYNQKPSGRFAFEGVTEKNINNPPPDTVPAEATGFQRRTGAGGAKRHFAGGPPEWQRDSRKDLCNHRDKNKLVAPPK